MPADRSPVPIVWIGPTLDNLKEFPEEVQDVMGYALYLAQTGGKHDAAKPLTGIDAFKGKGVMEVVDDFDGNTYRAVYTAKFEGVIYTLEAFQKKSKSGIATPKHVIERIKARLKVAEKHHKNMHSAKKAS